MSELHVVAAFGALDGMHDDALVVVADEPWLVAGEAGVCRAFAEETMVERAVLRSPDGTIIVGRAGDVRAGVPARVTRRLMTFRSGIDELLAVNDDVIDLVSGQSVAVIVGADAGWRSMASTRPGRDLARLLRYDDAVDPSAWYRVVADEIVEVPFWTPEYCTTIVRAAEALDAWSSEEHDPVPGREASLAAISPRLFAHVEEHVAAHVMPLLNEVWPLAEFVGLQDAFVIKYVPGVAGGLRLHHDVAQISASVRLTDGYRGGALEFPRQSFTNADVPVGHLVAWPSLVTHPHAANAVTDGVKYGLTLWFAIPGSE